MSSKIEIKYPIYLEQKLRGGGRNYIKLESSCKGFEVTEGRHDNHVRMFTAKGSVKFWIQHMIDAPSVSCIRDIDFMAAYQRVALITNPIKKYV